MSDLFEDPRKPRRKISPPTSVVFRMQNRERATAENTERSAGEIARLAAEQHMENRRLRYLTTLLGFAVIYDVVNGSFDDHTWWTTLISVGAGAIGLTGALLLGKWRSRRLG